MNTTPATDLRFYLNGTLVCIQNVDPAILLIDYLRSAEVGLTGTKMNCKQGGCGVCTVMLSSFDPSSGQIITRSMNSCMHPLASLDGMLVTTVEGTGSVLSAVSRVQQCLAQNNGTQCGFCTPGWIMNMTAAVVQKGNQPDTKIGTKQEIQAMFDGNLCRCTGYRPILYGFQKEFASDWNPEVDEKGCMTCLTDPAETVNVAPTITVQFPEGLKKPARPVQYHHSGYAWYRPGDVGETLELMSRHQGDNTRLVVGNTSIGVYDKYKEDPHVFIDIAQLAELRLQRIGKAHIEAGSALTYSEFIELLNAALASSGAKDGHHHSGLEAVKYMAGRTAGNIVRNAASLAGNTMMVVKHITTGAPFPSDMFTALAMMGTEVRIVCPGWKEAKTLGLLDFAEAYPKSKELQEGVLILGYSIPFHPESICQTYKCALREVNSHSIVNAGMRVRLDPAGKIADATLILGGIGPLAFHATLAEQALRGKALNDETLQTALAALTQDVKTIQKNSAARMSALPWEGFTDAYRQHLAQSFLYKFFVQLMEAQQPASVPAPVWSAGRRTERPASKGTQRYKTYPDEYPVNQPYIKLETFLQTTGEAIYPQDIPLPRRGLEAAFATSPYPAAAVHFIVPGKRGKATTEAVLAVLKAQFPGVVDIVTAADIPGAKAIGQGSDQPLFCIGMDQPDEGTVNAHGQALCLVLAKTYIEAQDAAQFLLTQCIHYAPKDPIISFEQAIDQDSIFPDKGAYPVHIWKITREKTDSTWANTALNDLPAALTLDQTPCIVVKGAQETGSQLHFYMESQAALALPGEDAQLILYPSTQSPDSIQSSAVDVLKSTAVKPGEATPRLNKVDVRVKRLGGGYGGKCDQSMFASAPAAVAAWKHQRPVRLANARAVDTAVYGHRHPLLSKYAVAIASDGPNKGKILGWRADFHLDGGYTYDASFVVSDCVQLRCDSAYFVPNWQTSSDVCKTNKASNTAFRSMGLVQGLIAQEEALEAAAHAIGMLPEDVRAKNLYQTGQTTPFGQVVKDCYLQRVWEATRKKSGFDKRLAQVNDFNAKNRWRKRGISLIPVKYASGYNATFLEQAGALVEVYDQDASVLVRQGGVDMGQGLNTIVAQIAAKSLGVSLSLVRIAEMDTAVIPNPVSTGASTGSAFNSKAVEEACKKLKKRLQKWLHAKGPDFCKNYQLFGQPVPLPYNTDYRKIQWDATSWPAVVHEANQERINLSEQVRVAIKGGKKTDAPDTFTFKPGTIPETVNQFVGFTFSAACTEVEIDVLTGETTVLRADLVYDMGKSINPAIDIGQVEGAFVQGLGFVLYEDMVYQPDGPYKGALNSLNTWEYKPPAVTSIPLEMHVDLFPYPRKIKDPNLLFSSKEVGEPPLCLAATVLFAVKHAILAARQDRGHSEWFPLYAPATVQRIREACLVEIGDLRVE